MADETNTETTAATVKAELMEKLKTLGVSFSNNSSVEKLQEKLEQAIAEADARAAGINVSPTTEVPAEETNEERRNRIRGEQLALVRCRITCMNNGKTALKGEYYTVANAVIGNCKRFVPYGDAGARGWHIERCIFEHLKSRYFIQHYEVDGPNGRKIQKRRRVPEFSLQELPQLTPEQLADLAKAQAAGNRIDSGDEDEI